MKRILRRCLIRLFQVASLTLILQIELLAGAGEDREDFATFQSRVHRLERPIERQRQNHLPALQWIKLGTLFCGTILLVTVFPYRKS